MKHRARSLPIRSRAYLAHAAKSFCRVARRRLKDPVARFRSLASSQASQRAARHRTAKRSSSIMLVEKIRFLGGIIR